MNTKKIAAVIAVSLCLVSCGGGKDLNTNEKTNAETEDQTTVSAGETAAEKNTPAAKKGTGYSFTVDEAKWKLMKENVGSSSADGGDNIFTYHNEYEFQYIGDSSANGSKCIFSVLVIDINEDVLNQSAQGTDEDIDTAMTEGIFDIGRAIASSTVDFQSGDVMLEDGETTFCGRKAYKFKYTTKADKVTMTVSNFMAYNNRKLLLFTTYGFADNDNYTAETDAVRDSFKFE